MQVSQRSWKTSWKTEPHVLRIESKCDPVPSCVPPTAKTQTPQP